MHSFSAIGVNTDTIGFHSLKNRPIFVDLRGLLLALIIYRESFVHPSTGASDRPERRDPDQDFPTWESIRRARAAQQRERAVFTLTVGVALDLNGGMILQFIASDPIAVVH